MANLDTNFLARPDFFVSTGENGQTITITLYPKIQDVSEFQVEAYNLTGWFPIILTDGMLLLLADGNLGRAGYIRSVTPPVYDNFEGNPIYDDFASGMTEEEKNIYFAVPNFMYFLRNNVVHISKINLRTQNEQVLPQQIIIKTPNIFAGQSDRQIIDVASRKNAYQYQNGIITLDNVDLFVGRNSSIVFNGAMQVSNGDQSENVLPENELYIDITIDKYLSLEKALVENLKLM